MTRRDHRLIAARLTPPGRGAVATIRLSGDFSNSANADAVSHINACFQAANQKPLSKQPLGKISFGDWGLTETEQLVVCRLDEHSVEIHCHGGEAAVQRILADLADAGCLIGDWRNSSVLSDDFIDRECLEALSQTSTWKTTQFVLRQSNGLLKSAFQKLLDESAHDHRTVNQSIDRMLNWAEFGLHLTAPWSVVLTGRPNVGKSSLINGLLGYERAIVFDQPGTTRDVVTGETAFSGWPVMLADTAGIRTGASPIEAAGIKLAEARLRSADLRLVLIDLSQPATPEDWELLTHWPDAIVIAHKSDLERRWTAALPDAVLYVSSVTREGLTKLQQKIVERLIPEMPDANLPIPLTQRHIDRLMEARDAESVDARQRALRELIQPETAKANFASRVE